MYPRGLRCLSFGCQLGMAAAIKYTPSTRSRYTRAEVSLLADMQSQSAVDPTENAATQAAL